MDRANGGDAVGVGGAQVRRDETVHGTPQGPVEATNHVAFEAPDAGFRIYRVNTSDAVFERLQLGVNGTAYEIASEAAGTGTARNILLTHGVETRLTVAAAGVNIPLQIAPSVVVGAFSETRTVRPYSQEVTLDTTALSTHTDSASTLLPAGAVILAVVGTVTKEITGASDWKLGDPTSAGRFSAASSDLTAGTQVVGLLHRAGNVATVALGATQAAAAKVRITTTGTATAGKILVTAWAETFA